MCLSQFVKSGIFFVDKKENLSYHGTAINMERSKQEMD